MDAEQFLEKFDTFADAPGAAEKLRALILGLAFAGRLTAGTDAAGWPRRTIKSISKSLTPGFACAKSHQVEGGHVHLRTHNVSTLGTLNFDLLVRINPAKVDLKKAAIRKGDVLFNNTNSQELVGKTCLVDRDYDYGFSNHITRLRLKEYALPEYVVYYLTYLRDSGHFARTCKRWIGQAGVNTKMLGTEQIPLPSPDEQAHIVAAVERLLALCDRLEAEHAERDARRAALARAATARFAADPTPDTLETLFHESFDVSPANLRNAALSAAVRGRLVVSERFKPPEAISMAELVDRKNLKNGLSLRSTEGGEYSCLPLSAMQGSIIDCRHGKPIDIPPEDAAPYLISPGDVFLIRGNGSKERVGFAGMVRECPPNVMFPDLFIRVGLPREIVDPRYFLLAWNGPANRARLEELAATTSGIWKINQGHVSKCEIPLPPLAEQRRIVAKADALLVLVDRLEAQQTAARDLAARTLDAAVAALVR